MLGAVAAPVHALAECKLAAFTVPVTMSGMRATIPAKINGTDVHFTIDSGAFYSQLTPAAAAELKLRLDRAPNRLNLEGVGGKAEASVATVRELTVFNVQIPHAEFIVAGGEPGQNTVGLLGQNLLRIGDIEYDLANGVIRLVRPEGCGDAPLAYWAKAQPASAIDIAYATVGSPYTTGTAYLDGTKIRVLFDTGAPTSAVARYAAERAGIKMDDPAVVVAGTLSGVGRSVHKMWIAPVASFKIGEEEIHNTRLRIADFDLSNTDMLIGADFFLSHRIYVANSQRKLYFTYNGGPVFNLARPQVTAAVTPESQPNSPSGSAVDSAPNSKLDARPESHEDSPHGDEPTDAAGFSRRGTAFTARGDFDHALADLNRACELGPNEPSYFYERGIARRRAGQTPALALSDFDRALTLKADDVPTLVERADLHVVMHDEAGAVADLDAAQRLAAKEDDIRFRIGALYLTIGHFAPAIAQYDLWIPAHEQEAGLPDGFNQRCWARALAGEDLKKALDDCNSALRSRPGTPRYLDSRALVQLRIGNLDKAIADWDAVLASEPKNAWALYARGAAKLQKGLTAPGRADMAAATALAPRIAEVARKRGVLAP
jgi:tetratricopeptide (TPR) repeat protein